MEYDHKPDPEQQCYVKTAVMASTTTLYKDLKHLLEMHNIFISTSQLYASRSSLAQDSADGPDAALFEMMIDASISRLFQPCDYMKPDGFLVDIDNIKKLKAELSPKDQQKKLDDLVAARLRDYVDQRFPSEDVSASYDIKFRHT